ncbi:MAG: N-acetylmuramic acid 6-phosphate etherase [Thermodesulfobacteriota bacterium]
MKKRRSTEHLITERINPRTKEIDQHSTRRIIELISEEDKWVADAVSNEKRNIEKAVVLIVNRLRSGARVVLVGAGTSGRLCVMEAAECPPTFGTKPNQILGIIAGGKKALWRSVEGAEDSKMDAYEALRKIKLNGKDVVVGVAASASTPFVEGALVYATKKGCGRILVTCNRINNSPLADVCICPIVGPEVIVGSTRMKAGTATKMVLNMLTTASMIKLGKTYENLMVDVQPRSDKLRDRAARIVMHLLGINRNKAYSLLKRSKWNVKVAIVMGSKAIGYKKAKEILSTHKGFLRDALNSE